MIADITIYLKTCYPIGTEPYKLPDGAYWDKLHLITMLSNIYRTCEDYSKVIEIANGPYEYSYKCNDVIARITIDPNYVVDSSVNHWDLDRIEFNNQVYTDYIYPRIDLQAKIQAALEVHDDKTRNQTI